MKPFFIPRLQKDKGFTIVEVLLTIGLLAMVIAAMTPFIRTVYTTWNVGDRRTALQQNGRVGLEMISRLLRQAKRITSIPLSGSGDFVKLRDSQDAQTIIFYHNMPACPYYIGNVGLIQESDLVMRTIDLLGAVNNALLAKSFSNFRIDFKTNSGGIATKPYQVTSMDISLRLTDPENLIPEIDMFSSISLRPEVKINNPVWVATGSQIAELSLDDWLTGFSSPASLSVNNILLINGRETVWVADTNGNCIYRIYWTGSSWAWDTITGGTGSNRFSGPRSVSVNPNEVVNGRETCWVADTGRSRIRRIYWTGSSWDYDNITGFSSPYSVSVNPNERVNGRNTCWVADTNGNRVRKIYWGLKGKTYLYLYQELIMEVGSSPRSVSVNTADGSCWVANSTAVRKLSSNPITILFTVGGFSAPYAVSVNSTTGECWVADTGNNRIKKLSSSGTVLLNLPGFNSPRSVSANSTEDSCWVADTTNSQAVKLDSGGNEEFRISGFSSPLSVAALP